MSVVCAACQTENRDNAMFCRGCAAKLPAFAATGSSAFDSMKPLRLPRVPVAANGPVPGMLPIETRAFWIRFAVLSIVITTAFVGWFAYVTRKVPVSPAAVAVAPLTRAPAPALPPAPVDHVQTTPSEPVRAVEALDARESIVGLGPARPEPPGLDTRYPTDLIERPLPPKRAVVRAASYADPRPACAHLNFIAAARCEASQCARAEYRSHPRCSAVREQTRRDVERRNPTLGY